MAKNLWCTAPSDPLVLQVAKKYNLSEKDARVVINNARENNVDLQIENIQLDFLEQQDSFKKALDVYIEKYISTDDILLDKPSGEKKTAKEFQEELREQFGYEYDEEDVEEMLERVKELPSAIRTSKKSARNIAAILKAFPDTRRLEFLGNWICCAISDYITRFDIDASMREKFGIQKHSRRIDYFVDTNAINAIRKMLLGDDKEAGLFEKLANDREDEGNTQLASELDAVREYFNTLLFMYGGSIFRDEGVAVGLDGTFEATDSDNSSSDRNEYDQSEEDDENEEEQPVTTFSASDQNKSITTKIVPSIKILLRTMRDTGKKGKTKSDPYGYGLCQYISVPIAVNKLLTLCRGCETFGEMIQSLEKNVKSTPWLEQLIGALDTGDILDATGTVEVSASRKEQLQSMFFQSFRKQFTKFRHMYQMYDENGDVYYVATDSNVRHRSYQLMRSIQRAFRRMAGLQILKDGGINFSVFDEIAKELKKTGRGRTTNPTLKNEIELVKAEALDIARKASEQGKRLGYETAYQALDTVTQHFKDILEKFGIKVSEEMINDFLSNGNEDFRSSGFYGNYDQYGEKELIGKIARAEKLLKQIQYLNDAFIKWGEAIDKGETSDTPYTNPFGRKADFNDVYIIRNWYRNIINGLTEFSSDSYENRAHVNKKDYYSWNNPSSIATVVENLARADRERVREYIRKKFTQDSLWFMKPTSTQEDPHFYSDMLEELYHGQGNEIIDYSEVLSFCGDTYNDMSDMSYNLCMLNDYFTVGFDGEGANKKTAQYRMYIAGDKPRYVSIKWKRYADDSMTDTEFGWHWAEENYHNVIARKAVDFFAQEIRRSEEVIRHAISGDDLSILGYDIEENDETRPILEKMRKGERVTVADVVTDGKYIFRGTGAAFYLNKFINKEIENNTKLGQYVVDKIFNSRLSEEPVDVLNDNSISLFKQGFHSYMQDIKEKYIKHLDDSGVFAARTQKGDHESIDTVHLKYLAGNMRQWHTGEEKFAHIMYGRKEEIEARAEKEGIDLKAHPEERTFLAETIQFERDLEEFVYNNWLAKANFSEIFDVDLAFYGNTTNFQKRNAQVVSSGHTTDPDAKIHGKKVSDGFYRSMTILTKKIRSQHLANIEAVLQRRASQIADKDMRHQFESGMNDTLQKLKSFDATDGQGLTGLTALRKRRAGQGEWSRSDAEELDNTGYVEDKYGNKHYIYTDEAVYQRMKRGEARTEDLMHVFAQVQKDFVYTTQNIKREGRGTITVPIQHKNSEFALVYLTAFAASQTKGSQLEAISRFLEETAEDDITKGIDTINFDSAVKIGGNTRTVDLDNLSYEETLDALYNAAYGHSRKYFYGKKKGVEFRKDGAKREYRQGAVTEYDATDYKIVQEKPEHFKKHMQPMGTQLKILAINNISDTATVTLPNGKEITGKELKKRYFDALKKKMQGAERDFRYSFGLRQAREGRIHKISNAIKRAMSTDQKFTVDMRRQLSVTTRDGIDVFTMPMDEPGIQSAIEALLLSKFRRAFYKEKTNGGIIVQATSWGTDKNLHIRFFSSNPEDIEKRNGLVPTLEEFAAENNYGEDAEEKYKAYLKDYQKGYAYFEMECTMPDYVRDMIKNSDGSIDKKFYLPDGNWNMEEIRKVVPDSVFDCIMYRVPTEAKYSIMAGRVVRFSKEGAGSVAKLPLELTEFTGSDFDIDTDTVELRPKPKQKRRDIDNEIFDLQLAALRSDPAIGETFKSGDFSDLSEESYYLTLLEAGIPSEILDKKTGKQLKQMCAEYEDMDLMNPVTDVILHNQNSDAKDMIGIAAVGVTSHAFLSLYNDVDLSGPQRDPNKHPENFVRIQFKEGDGKRVDQTFTVINDKDKAHKTEKYFGGDVLLDMMYDMDGKLISTEISKYVGASADAAKDAALYRLGLNKKTLPIALLMHRIGVSSDVIRAFMKQPAIKYVVRTLSTPSQYGYNNVKNAVEAAVEYFCAEAGLSEKEAEREWNYAKESTDKTIRYSDLKKSIQDPKSQSIGDKLKILYLFGEFAKKGELLRNLDGFTRYNSPNAMKGSSFLDRYAKRNSLLKLQKNLEKEKPTIKLPQDIELIDGIEPTEFGKLCSMFPHIGQIIMGEEEMIEDIILDNMHTYNSTFFDIVHQLGLEEDAESMKELYAGWKNYLLFVGDKRIADFHNEAVARKYTRDFAEYYAETIDRLSDIPELAEGILKDNSFISSIGYIHAKDGYGDFDLLSTNITGLGGTALEKYRRDWEALLSDSRTRQLAIDLGIHFLARSAAFSRDTPVTVMPLVVKEALPNYAAAFEDADKMQMDEEEQQRFIVAFCRNNADDKKIIPHLYNTKERVIASYKKAEDGNYGVISIDAAKSGKLSNWFEKVQGEEGEEELGSRLKAPMISIDGKLYLVLNDTIQQQKIGSKSFYIIEAMPVSPLGIPNQIAEYTGFFQEDSIFLDDGQEAPSADQESEYQPQETPYVEPDPYDDIVIRGDAVGMYINSAPFGFNAVNEDVEDVFSRSEMDYRTGYAESRTHLRRIGRLAQAVGLKLSSSERGYNEKFVGSYMLNVTMPADMKGNSLAKDQHEEAVKLAALISGLGYETGNPTVKTYVNSIDKANAVEVAVPIGISSSELERYERLFAQTGLTTQYNAETKELCVIDYFGTEDAGDRLHELKNMISTMKEFASRLGVDERLEVNFVQITKQSASDRIRTLTEIQDEARENERIADKQNSKYVGEGRNDSRQQVKLSDLAELAIKRLQGKEVEDDIRKAFNERWSPIRSESRFVDIALRDMSDDVYNAIQMVLAGKASYKRNITQLVNNLIANTANWIRGNRPEGALEEMLGKVGFEQTEQKAITTLIKSKLEEQDIC